MIFKDEPGFDVDAFEAILQTPPPVSIRWNIYKSKPEERQGEVVPWCSEGRYLPERPVFALDPFFHAGAYYVQEASSMSIGSIIQQYISEPVIALDACAAPGGKSTLLIDALPNGSLVVANEVIAERAAILKENVEKWGHPALMVTRADPSQFQKLPGMFDLILCDAPCSGSGMWRKDPETQNEWSKEHVNLCASRQKRIVADLWTALKTDGIFIYATCSYSSEENEKIVTWIVENLKAEILPINIPNTHTSAEGIRFYPWKNKGEGFFVSALKKIAETPMPKMEKIKQIGPSKIKFNPNIPGNWNTYSWDGMDKIMPENYIPILDKIYHQIKTLHIGFNLGKVIREEWIPDAECAYIPGIEQHFPVLELNKHDALQYLRKIYHTDLPPGWYLAAFHGRNLGFLKAIPGRINNYFPTSKRLRIS